MFARAPPPPSTTPPPPPPDADRDVNNAATTNAGAKTHASSAAAGGAREHRHGRERSDTDFGKLAHRWAGTGGPIDDRGESRGAERAIARVNPAALIETIRKTMTTTRSGRRVIGEGRMGSR